MRIAVFSDIHGNLEALKEILNDIENEKIDEVICLGDVIGLGPESKECLDLIISKKIKFILGNHELCYLFGFNIDKSVDLKRSEHYKYIDKILGEEEHRFLEKCPLFIECKYLDKKILFEHFLIKDRNLKYPYYSLNILTSLKDSLGEIVKKTGNDYIFIGHEHTGFEFEVDDIKLIDIGSSGCVKNNIIFYTIIEFKNDISVMKKVITYNKGKLEKALLKEDYPERLEIASKFFGINIEKENSN